MSILESVKKLLSIPEDVLNFDADIIFNINMALNTLTQLGVGPEDGFKITGNTETLEDFIPCDTTLYESIIMYLYLKTRIIFDPPTSAVMSTYKEQIAELENRLEWQADPCEPFKSTET